MDTVPIIWVEDMSLGTICVSQISQIGPSTYILTDILGI